MKICDKANKIILKNINWQFPKEIEAENSFTKIQLALFAEAAKLETNAGMDAAHTVGLLAHISGLHLQSYENNEPFKNIATFTDGSRTFHPDDLTQDQIEILIEILPLISNKKLKNRIY